MERPIWHAWIPTNLGVLDFKYIGKIDNLINECLEYNKTTTDFSVEELNTKSISDTYTPISENNIINSLFKKALPSLSG